MLLEATRGCRWRPQSSKNVHHFGMLYIILLIFGYATSIADREPYYFFNTNILTPQTLKSDCYLIL